MTTLYTCYLFCWVCNQYCQFLLYLLYISIAGCILCILSISIVGCVTNERDSVPTALDGSRSFLFLFTITRLVKETLKILLVQKHNRDLIRAQSLPVHR